MPVRVCSLITNAPQPVPGDGAYHLLRFPFGAAESYDAHGMHPAEQPDGYVVGDWAADDRSGLIWPHEDGWGSLTAMIHWEGGGYTEIRDQFARDPLNLAGGIDTTCTQDRPPTPGGQFLAKHHELFVHAGTPLGLGVRHNDATARAVVHAQFKLAIHT